MITTFLFVAFDDVGSGVMEDEVLEDAIDDVESIGTIRDVETGCCGCLADIESEEGGSNLLRTFSMMPTDSGEMQNCIPDSLFFCSLNP